MGNSTRTNDTDKHGRDTDKYTYTEKRDDGKIEYRHYHGYEKIGKDVYDPKTDETEHYDRLNRKK